MGEVLTLFFQFGGNRLDLLIQLLLLLCSQDRLGCVSRFVEGNEEI